MRPAFLHVGLSPWENPWHELNREMPTELHWRNLGLMDLHEVRPSPEEGRVQAIFVDLDAVARTEPLNDWSLRAWRATFNELVTRFVRDDGHAPLLVGYTRDPGWERASIAVKIGARDLCKLSQVAERLDALAPEANVNFEAPPLPDNVVPLGTSASPAPHLQRPAGGADAPVWGRGADARAWNGGADARASIPKNAIPFPIHGIEGHSPAIEQVRVLVRRCAPMNTSVLVTGPTGSGKERVARALHVHSERSQRPFIAVNCGAIAPGLFESELFGHLKGSFTGAHADRPGYFQAAEGGTLFLDEVAALPAEFQPKLLRALQERSVVPVGAQSPVAVDVRIVSSTHVDLDDKVRYGKFREDLLYRLRVIELRLPSLAERKVDLPVLSESIFRKLAKQHRRSVLSLGAEALEKFLRYDWPGNVRELENILEHAATLAWAEERHEVTEADLPESLQWAALKDVKHQALKDAVRRFEHEYISQTLKRLGGSKEDAAEILGLSLATLYRKLGN
jgi:transcriptional regulator with AAA-type ATPase domain